MHVNDISIAELSQRLGAWLVAHANDPRLEVLTDQSVRSDEAVGLMLGTLQLMNPGRRIELHIEPDGEATLWVVGLDSWRQRSVIRTLLFALETMPLSRGDS